MNISLERYNIGFADARTPWVADDAFLKVCIKEQIYPSSYPEEINPEIIIGKKIDIKATDLSINNCGAIIHSLGKLKCKAAEAINIHLGSIIVGDRISLKAPIVRIYDENEEYPIRTTLWAKQELYIEADKLIIDGADIPHPGLHAKIIIKSISVKNVTENTRWLVDLINKKTSQ